MQADQQKAQQEPGLREKQKSRDVTASCGTKDLVYNTYYCGHHGHKQQGSKMKTHWSTISVFGSVCIFSDLSSVRYNQEIRSALQTPCPGSEHKKGSFVWNGSHLSSLALFQAQN